MKLWLVLLFTCSLVAVAAEMPRDAKIVAALAEAEKFVAAEQWRPALEAGNRLRTLCIAQNGEEHPDTALAELFLGEVRDHLGDRTLAEAHFRRALAIQEKVLRADAPEFVSTLTRLAACLKAQHRYDEAAGLLQRALDLQTKIGGADDPDLAVSCTNLARLLRLKRDYVHAAALLQRALAIQRRARGGTDPEIISGLRELAQVHELAGDLAAAELDTAERVVATEAQFGAQSSELATALSDWGRFAEQQAHFAAAEPRYRRSLTISEAILATDDPALAPSLTQVGWCLRHLERYDEARPLLQRALDLRLRKPGPEHLDTASSYRNLGWIDRLKRDFEAARPHFEKALAIRENKLGPTDPLTLESLAELGDLHWLRGAYDEAADLLERRRYRLEETTGPASEETTAAWHGLAIVYESAKRWPQAIDAALRSLRATEPRLGAADSRTLGELVLLSRICEAAGAFGPALTQYARLAAWFRQHPEAAPAASAELLRQFAIATLRAGRAEEAGPLFRESRRLHESAFGADDPATLRSLGDLWTYFDQTHQPTLAREMARELAARTGKVFGADAPATVAVFDRVGQLCLTLGERAEAMQWFRRALDGRRRHFGDGSAELLDSLAQIAFWFEDARDFATAVALRTERLGAVERKFGRESETTAAACGDLALAYFRQGDLASARGMFTSQLTLVEKKKGGESAEALAVVAQLGDVAAAAKDWPTAVQQRERLADGCARRFGHEHLERGRALLLLGEALLANGADPRAGAGLRDAHRILQAAGTAQSGATSRAAAALGRVTLRRGDLVEAKRWTHEALAGTATNDEAQAEAFSLLGEELSRAGDAASAEAAFTRALTILSQVVGDHDEHTLALLERVAHLRLRLGNAGATELLERALAASEALHGSGTPEMAEILGWQALAGVQEGRYPAAHAAARRMLEIVRKARGAGDPSVALAREIEAWTALRTAAAAELDTALDAVADLVLSRWQWIQPVSERVAASFAEARALAAP
jgi:tetratricopeptide (TPR) repeat protein